VVARSPKVTQQGERRMLMGTTLPAALALPGVLNG
jgi:hypothetical protein